MPTLADIMGRLAPQQPMMPSPTPAPPNLESVPPSMLAKILADVQNNQIHNQPFQKFPEIHAERPTPNWGHIPIEPSPVDIPPIHEIISQMQFLSDISRMERGLPPKYLPSGASTQNNTYPGRSSQDLLVDPDITFLDHVEIMEARERQRNGKDSRPTFRKFGREKLNNSGL